MAPKSLHNAILPAGEFFRIEKALLAVAILMFVHVPLVDCLGRSLACCSHDTGAMVCSLFGLMT